MKKKSRSEVIITKNMEIYVNRQSAQVKIRILSLLNVKYLH